MQTLERDKILKAYEVVKTSRLTPEQHEAFAVIFDNIANFMEENTRPAPAATDTGLETIGRKERSPHGVHFLVDLPEGTELVTRSQAEAIIRDLETKILEAAISDRLDDAGSPLSWQERAEIAEGIISDLKADNAAQAARIKELDRCHEGTIDLCNQKTAQIEALEAKLEAAEKALETYKAVVKDVCESQRGTKWGKCAECIFDAIERAALGGKPSC